MIAVSVNSGLGSISQAHLISESIKKVSLDKNSPIFTFAEDQAFGPGYYILSMGNKVFCDENSFIGGIGASYKCFGLKKFADSWNVKVSNFSQEKYKLRLDMFEKMSNDDQEWIEKVLKNLHEEFKKHVQKQRGHKLLVIFSFQKQPEILDGNIYIGEQAVKQGQLFIFSLVDELGELSQVSNRDFGDTLIYDLSRQRNKGLFWNQKMFQNLLEKQDIGEIDLMNAIDDQWLKVLNERKVASIIGDLE